VSRSISAQAQSNWTSTLFSAFLTLADGASLDATPLFGFTQLLTGCYTGSFFLTDGINALETPPQEFAFTVGETTPSPVPEPSSLTLLASGSLVLIALGRRARYRNV
jgi:hypothetical protein